MRGTRIRRWTGVLAAAWVAAGLAAGLATPAAAGAQGGTAAPDRRPTLAVMYFTNAALGGRNAEYAPLSKGIAEMLITELAANESIRVIERDQLQQLLQEQNLGATDRVDKETAVQLGKVLGARHFLMGGFIIDPKDNVRLDVRAVNVETSQIEHVETLTGKAENLLAIIADMGKKLNAGLRLPAIDPNLRRARDDGPAAGPAATPAASTGASTGGSAAAGRDTAGGAAPSAERPAGAAADRRPSRPAGQPAGQAGTTVTATSNKKIDQKRLVLLLGRALEAKDRGDVVTAKSNYREALQADPGFRRAEVLLTALERRPAGT